MAQPTRLILFCQSKAPGRRACLLLCLMGLLLMVSPLSVQATPTIRLGLDLRPELIQLQSLSDRAIVYFDQHRNLQTEPLSRSLQLRFAAAAASDADPSPANDAGHASEPAPRQRGHGMIRLTDGQQFVGRLVEVQDDRLVWEHPRLGRASVQIDQVIALAPAGGLPARVQVAADELHLTNGDVIHGFVEQLTLQAVTLRPGGQDAVDLPMNRVAQVRLANPRVAATTGHLLHLADGSRVRAARLTIQGQHVTAREPATLQQDIECTLADVRRVDLATPNHRLVELEELNWQQQAGGQAFGVAVPPRLLDGVFYLHAPVVVRVDLPAGATRFAAMLQLDEQQTDTARLAWADFSVVLRDESGLLATQPINIRTRRAAVVADLAGSALWIELDPGPNGPIMTRLRITDAVVLVEATD